jgi:ABC-type glutathione transport system ATPase component
MNVISARRAEPLLEIRNLTIRYREGERQVTAVRDVSFTLEPGGALAIVGESGSGKSSVAGAILDFLGPAAEVTGAILFEGQDLAELTPAQRRNILGRRIGAVFQDPFTALNPALRIGRQIASSAGSAVDLHDLVAGGEGPTETLDLAPCLTYRRLDRLWSRRPPATHHRAPHQRRDRQRC